MKQEEFEKEFQLLRDEVYAATLSWHTYLTVHNEAYANKELLDAMNRNPSFWLITLRAHLHNTLIVLGRVFDTNKSAASIQKFSKAVVEHKGFFSREALCARRLKEDPAAEAAEWWKDWAAKAHIPDEKHLKALDAEVSDCVKLWDSGYDDFRNNVVAHRARLSKEDLDEVYSKTKVGDITRLLERLYNIETAIQNLYVNGNAMDFKHRINPRVAEAMNAAKGTLATILKGTSNHRVVRPTPR